MKVKNFYIKQMERSEVKEFIETWHYSESINGLRVSYCFGLFNEEEEMIGAVIYGKLAMCNQWKPYGSCEEDVIELRRLCCIDKTPKNTESRFIGLTLRWLKKNTNIKKVVSYADPNYGHEGIIYKASNFNYIGTSATGRVIIYNNKKYHDKAIRTKYKGKLKPFAVEIKEALEKGEAYYKKQVGKRIYTYTLKLEVK